MLMRGDSKSTLDVSQVLCNGWQCGGLCPAVTIGNTSAAVAMNHHAQTATLRVYPSPYLACHKVKRQQMASLSSQSLNLVLSDYLVVGREETSVSSLADTDQMVWNIPE